LPARSSAVDYSARSRRAWLLPLLAAIFVASAVKV
jgi:hypothetical protein